MSSSLLCPECKRKLTVPETLLGKSFRCPACKTIIPPTSKARTAESDSKSDEAEAARPSRAVKTASSPRTAPVVVRRPPPRVEEPDEDIDADDEEPIRDKPRRKKRPIRKSSSSGLVIGLVVGGVVLFLLVLGIGGAVLWVVLRVKTIPESAWQTFSPKDGDCTVSMPGMPTTQPLNILGVQVTQYQVERKKEKVIFVIGIYDLPLQFVPPNLLDDMVNGMRTGAMISMDGGGTVTSDSNITLGNIPGREFQIKPTKNPGLLIGRAYLAKVGTRHRAYLLMAGGDNMKTNSSDAARFFDSFKLTATATAPDLNGAAAGGRMQPPAFNPPPANPQPNMPRPNFPGKRPPRMPRRPL